MSADDSRASVEIADEDTKLVAEPEPEPAAPEPRDPETGMPVMEPKTADPQNAVVSFLKSSMWMPVPLSMGMGARNVAVSYLLAFAINAFGEKAKYAALTPESSDAAFGFLTAIVFARMVMTLNWYPMEHKSKIMGSHGDLRTNMAVYKAMDAQGAPTGRAIVMDPDGATGEYNRANRSLSHFVEFAPAVLMLLAAAGSVYKLPCFILTLLLAYGRVEHQRGESKNYGSHGNGFRFCLIAQFTLEGLCAIAALQSFGVDMSFGLSAAAASDDGSDGDTPMILAAKCLALVVLFVAVVKIPRC